MSKSAFMLNNGNCDLFKIFTSFLDDTSQEWYEEHSFNTKMETSKADLTQGLFKGKNTCATVNR